MVQKTVELEWSNGHTTRYKALRYAIGAACKGIRLKSVPLPRSVTLKTYYTLDDILRVRELEYFSVYKREAIDVQYVFVGVTGKVVKIEKGISRNLAVRIFTDDLATFDLPFEGRAVGMIEIKYYGYQTLMRSSIYTNMSRLKEVLPVTLYDLEKYIQANGVQRKDMEDLYHICSIAQKMMFGNAHGFK